MDAFTFQFVDLAEVARILGLSRAGVATVLRSDETFPRWEGAGTTAKSWRREAILRWAHEHPNRGGKYCPAVAAAPGVLAPRIALIAELAHNQARSLGHHWIGVEHLVLAMVAPGCPGLAPRVLTSFGVELRAARRLLEDAFGDPFEPADDGCTPIQYSPRFRLVAERAYLKARELQDETVDSEHLLLALLDAWDDAPLVARVAGSIGSIDLARRVQELSEADLLVVDHEGLDEVVGSVGLRSNPMGLDPRRRRPWTSRFFVNSATGRPVVENKQIRQYLVDRDGYPVVTTDGSFVDLDSEGGVDDVASIRVPSLLPIVVPVGAVANARDGAGSQGPRPG